MKKILNTLALVAVLALVAQPALAHPGTHCHQHNNAKKCS